MEMIYFDRNVDNRKYYLIIYDISNDKRRYKIAKLLEGYGKRVQMSAFECWLNDRLYKKLNNSLDKISKEEDNIRIYHLLNEPIDVRGDKCGVLTSSDLYVV